MFSFILKLLCIPLCWRVRPRGGFDEADCYIVQSFGLTEDEAGRHPGAVNKRLGMVLTAFYHRHPKPILAQWEVADVLAEAHVPVDHRIEEHRIPGKYLDTYEVISQEYDYASARQLHTAILIAHPRHMWRCTKTAERLGFQVVLPRELLTALEQSANIYDPDSIQWQTRNLVSWVIYEVLLARGGYLLKGYI